ncbi:MAG: methyltransferase [Bacteroidota bacterium]
MSNSYFNFKQFTVHQDKCAMKVTTDSCLFGAWVANEAKSKNATFKNILDVGTGTGLLALMIAQANTESSIDGIEIDKEACGQAEENIKASPWKTGIDIHCGDVKEFLFNKKYDLILSNPPFYENELNSDNNKRNIAHHSENLSLDDILRIIKNNLADNGIFFLLLPYKRKVEIELLLEKNGLFISKKVLVRQTVHHDYFRIMLAGNTNADTQTEENEISIKSGERQYTADFAGLLKDYYLHL